MQCDEILKTHSRVLVQSLLSYQVISVVYYHI